MNGFSGLCIIIILCLTVLVIFTINNIETKKVKILRLYSQIKISDAKRGLTKAKLFHSSLTSFDFISKNQDKKL